MHQAIELLILNPQIHFIDRIVYIKLPAGKFQEKIASIEKIWREIMPDIGFDYLFVSTKPKAPLHRSQNICHIGYTYDSSWRLWSCFLYGRAEKEKVGIRKVMGAAAPQVIAMFLWLFINTFNSKHCRLTGCLPTD
jgi:putative ABC transport system permease protein